MLIRVQFDDESDLAQSQYIIPSWNLSSFKGKIPSNYVDFVLQFNWGGEDIMLTARSLLVFLFKGVITIKHLCTFFSRKENSSRDLSQLPRSTPSWFLRVVLVLCHLLPCRWLGRLTVQDGQTHPRSTMLFVYVRENHTIFLFLYMSCVKQSGLEKSVPPIKKKPCFSVLLSGLTITERSPVYKSKGLWGALV